MFVVDVVPEAGFKGVAPYWTEGLIVKISFMSRGVIDVASIMPTIGGTFQTTEIIKHMPIQLQKN